MPDALSADLALVERFSGIRLDAEPLSQPHGWTGSGALR
jgi:hypothetical protein